MGNSRPSDWNTRRKKILEKDGYTCQNCNYSGTDLEVHHIVALEDGGSNRLSNLTTLCYDCHRAIHEDRKSAPTTDGYSKSDVKIPSLSECKSCSSGKPVYEGNALFAFCSDCYTHHKYDDTTWSVFSCPKCGHEDIVWGEFGRLGRCQNCENEIEVDQKGIYSF